MKLNITILMAMFLAFSGFTWGSDSEKKVSNDPYANSYSSSATVKKAKAASSMANSYGAAASSYVPTGAPSDRATAIRVLTSGDEATRKARLESLTRVAKAMSARKQQAQAQQSTY